MRRLAARVEVPLPRTSGRCSGIREWRYAHWQAKQVLQRLGPTARLGLSSKFVSGGGAKPREEEPVPRRSEPVPCDICKALLNGPDQYRDHPKSKRHKHEKARGGPGRCVMLTRPLDLSLWM